MKKRLGIILIAASFLPPILSAEVNSQQAQAPQINQNDNRYMHPAYQRYQNYQQNFYNRQRPPMHRPMPPAYMQKMQEQHEKRIEEQRERMQQMHSQRQNRPAHECGPQNQARNHSIRPDRPMRPQPYRAYPGPRHPAYYPERMRAPQRPVFQGSPQSAYRGHPAQPQWNQYQARFNNQQAPRRFYQQNHYRQAPPMMPTNAYMAYPNRGQAAQQVRNFYPDPGQRYGNGYRFGNPYNQHRVPPVAYQPQASRYQLRQQARHPMPAYNPYRVTRVSNAAYAR